ncbi:MAG: preprotein translocase subunit SecG [Prevotellaceae bacterium]|nr:preprotein translocase subunit SecG [Prevotellaceae bacterium]
MYTLFVILIVLASFCMIGIVLIQESKGGGLASAFSNVNNVAGVRQTTNFIEKTTWTLAAAMVIISIICAYVAPNASTEGSVIEKAATEQSTTNPNNVQGFGAAPAADAQQAPAPAAETPAAPAK